MDLLALSAAKKFTMEKLPCYFGDPIDLNVEWDGVIGDRYYEDSTSGTSGGKYVRISDYVPTEEQLQIMTILQRKSDGTTVEYGWDMIKKRRKNEALAEGGTKITCYPYLMIVPKNYITTTIGTHGIYAYHLPEIYTERVHIPCIDYEVGKTLDPRLLPSGGGGFATVTLATEIPIGGNLTATLSAEESEQLTTAWENGNPLLVNCSVGGYFSLQSCASRAIELRGFMLILPLADMLACVVLVDAENTGIWSLSVSGVGLTQ